MREDNLDLVKDYLKNKSSNTCYELVTRHQSSVFGMCYRVLRNREEAEEAAQDTFLKFFESLHKLKEVEKYKSWMLSIAYRTAIDLYRKRKPGSSSIEELSEQKVTASEDPDILLQAKSSTEVIEQVIASMGEQDAPILNLFYLEDMPVKEIATTLKLTESNVKIRLMRSRELLRKKLRPLYELQLKK